LAGLGADTRDRSSGKRLRTRGLLAGLAGGPSQGQGRYKRNRRGSRERHSPRLAKNFEMGLVGNDEDDEGAGLEFSAAFAGSRRIEIRSREKDVVRLGIERHGAGAALGGDILDDSVLIGRILVDDGEGAFAVR